MLTIRDSLPEGLLACAAGDLHEHLGGPTLLSLAGARDPALFVSVLLHGNETAGWMALRSVLERHARSGLPRSLLVFIGNVEAARAGVRRLDTQPDFNRIWCGNGTAYHAMAREIFELCRARGIAAALDVHNTTGRNPHYAVVARDDPDTLALAGRFARRVVHSTQPDTVAVAALGALAPAVTVECGQPGHAYGVEHAEQFLESCLLAEDFTGEPDARDHLELYEAVARVRVPECVGFGFDGDDGEHRGGQRPAAERQLCFAADLDTLNFHEIPSGTVFARLAPGADARLEAWSEDGREVADRYFRRAGDAIVNAVPLMPSMLTLDARAVRQDCLCYLMERVGA